jgi:Fungal specific transcription factor domain
VLESPYSRNPPQFRYQENLKEDHSTHEAAPSPDEELRLAKRYSLKNDDNDKLRLIHHYAISTCYSISDPTSVTQSLPLRDTVPSLAFEHDFLLSGLLAVTSLHLALLNPSNIHSASAIKFHTEALAQVQPHLTNVLPDNVAALFSFSCLIASYSFGFHQIQAPLVNSLDAILEVFTLIRGIRIIVRDGMQWLQESPFAENLVLNPSDPNGSLPPPIEDAIFTLSQRISKQEMDSASREAYTTAVDLLRQSFLLVVERPNIKMVALPFPILVNDDFIQKLKGKDSLALVILANYAVVLYWLKDYIWLRGWGKEIVEETRDALGLEWQECLEWALEEIKQ